jgi:hypothetical protein
MNTADSVPDDIVALHAELAAERAARREAEARAIGAEAMVTHLKLVIAKLEHHRYGASSERGRKLLDQAELQLEELEADVAEAATVTDTAADQAGSVVRSSCVASRCVALCGTLAARACRHLRTDRMPLLWWRSIQAGRDDHRDAGERAAPVEGDPDGA